MGKGVEEMYLGGEARTFFDLSARIVFGHLSMLRRE